MTEGHEPLPEKWRRFRKRPVEERALILRAMVLLPLTGIGLRVFGFQRWKKLIEQFSLRTRTPQVAEPAIQLEMADRAVRAVRSVELHGLSAPNCLERSMTLWWLLRRDGIAGELHIGARKNGSRLEAHAWVELGGQVLNDSAEVHNHYARFDAPIAAAGEEDSHAAGEADSH
jgi:hypothetical protein